MSHTDTGPWKEREYLDLWSVVHLFSCFAIGGLFIYLNIEVYIACAIAVFLFAFWEIFEHLANIHEKSANRVSDVIVDYIGFFGAQLYTYAFHQEMHWYIPTIAALIAIALETWGIIDFWQRKKKQK